LHEIDGVRYIRTGTYNVTQDTDTGWYDMGTYRIMVKDAKTVPSIPGLASMEGCISKSMRRAARRLRWSW